MPPYFIIILENDGVLMDRGNINFTDSPLQNRAGLTSYLSSCVADNAVEKGKAKQAADCCRKILNHVNQAVKESENKQVGYFSRHPLHSHPKSSLLFSCSATEPRLPYEESVLITFPLSRLLSVLPLEVRGLPEKTGPLLLKADRQPNDPGVKGVLSTRPL